MQHGWWYGTCRRFTCNLNSSSSLTELYTMYFISICCMTVVAIYCLLIPTQLNCIQCFSHCCKKWGNPLFWCECKFWFPLFPVMWANELSRYCNWLRAGLSGIESWWGRDFLPVQTGPVVHPASCKMVTSSFLGVMCVWVVLLTPHPLLVSRSWKSRVIPLLKHLATKGL